MTRSIDLPELEPLLRLLQEGPFEVAVAAVEAAVRLPLTDEAWRALSQEIVPLLGHADAPPALRDRLIAAAARVPVRSTRLRLRDMAEYGESGEREAALRAMAEAGDPEIAALVIESVQEAPAHEREWAIARLARMPIEMVGIGAEDLPGLEEESHPEVFFWHALAYARLGSTARLERVLRGDVEPPRMLFGNPWFAYAEIAQARPLPESLQTHILEMFDIEADPAPDATAVRNAGLLVWALTGIADAEGYLVEAEPGSIEEPVQPEWSAEEVTNARETARDILRSVEQLVNEDIDVRRLRALPAAEVGDFVRSLLRAGQALAAMREGIPHFVFSNPIVGAIAALPRADLPVRQLFADWRAAEQPLLDAEQFAWVLERGGADAVLEAAAETQDLGLLEVLGAVGDVATGVAGSPWRGSGGGGATVVRRDIIEDIGWAESAPPPAEESSAREAGPPPPPPPPSASRGAGPPPPPPPAGGSGDTPPPGEPTESSFKAVLSAEGPKELNVGAESAVRVRVEHEAGARPLTHSATVTVRYEPISVMLFLSNEFVQLKSAVLQEVAPPTPDKPVELEFPIVAAAAGETRAIVHFQQGTNTLAMLTFTTRVVDAGASADTTVATGSTPPRDPYDDGVVRILIQQPTADEPCYTYYVTSKLLGLVNKKYKSPVFEESGSVNDRPKAYAKSIYDKIERALLEKGSDARALETRLERVGREMCKRLFEESLIRELWKHRDRIQSIEITPVEPYIPWELLRLEHPEEGVDSRHLSEYRLVRVLGGREPARMLGRSEWRYVLGEYPNQLYADLPDEKQFLTNGLPALGVTPVAVPSRLDDILDVVDPAEFDVIHFACHGEASLDRIDDSALIVADRFSAHDQKPVAVKVYPSDMTVDLSPRRPLVFLSACQSGRMAPSLADFGGWPRVFVDAQAGAMVGTSWEVHEKPAVAFANAFYASLLRGETLGEAAGAGRAAARALRDASWLAYTVYGWSSTRMSA